MKIENTGLIKIDNKTKQLSKRLLSSFFKLKNNNSPEFMTVEKKYYVVEMTNSSKIQKNKNDKKGKIQLKLKLQ